MDLLGAARTANSAVSVLDRCRAAFAAASRARSDLNAARRLLGIADPDSFSYRVADHHPIYNVGDPHPDDQAGFVAVLASAVSPSLTEADISYRQEIPCRLDDGLVLIGSPEGEPIARLVFGYSPVGDDGLQFDGDTIDLPYRWEEDRRKVEATYTRFVPGRGATTRPNWPVIDNTGMGARVFYPKLDRDGFSKNDWLLVTRIPNIASRDALQSGRSLVSIAGSHGTATRAVGILLRDRRALREIGRTVPENADGFQALIEVSDIVHDPVHGSYARAVQVRGIREITRSAASWEASCDAVRRRYDAWLAVITKTSRRGTQAEPA